MRLIQDTDNRQEIVITEELSDITDQAAKLLALDGEIYQRGGSLVHIVTPTPISDDDRVAPIIRILPLPTLRVRLAQVARWLKVDAKGNYRRVNVPDAITAAVHTRGQWNDVRPLIGVTTAPTMRPDGSVLQVPGYDRATGLLYTPSVSFCEVPDRPTREDALIAANEILDLVCDFPFAGDATRSAWLAGLLTMVGRHAIDGPTPLFVVDANTRGSGKSRLVDVAVMLAHGIKAARSSISEKDEEMRKQITSLLAEGCAAALIDNVKSGGSIGSPAFDALMTSEVWKERNLGRIENLTLPARCVWWTTGNNIKLAGDLSRRGLKIRLESPLENPEERDHFKHGAGDELLNVVERNRWKLVAQALIILRAHAIAKRPACGPLWGSYEAWSRSIAGAIRWIGLPDPLDARATADESGDEDRLHMIAIVGALEAIGRPVTTRELLSELYPHGAGYWDGNDAPPDPSPSFGAAREAIEVATSAKGIPNANHVGYFLRRIRGRVVGCKIILGNLDPHTKVQRWTVKNTTTTGGPLAGDS